MEVCTSTVRTYKYEFVQWQYRGSAVVSEYLAGVWEEVGGGAAWGIVCIIIAL